MPLAMSYSFSREQCVSCAGIDVETLPSHIVRRFKAVHSRHADLFVVSQNMQQPTKYWALNKTSPLVTGSLIACRVPGYREPQEYRGRCSIYLILRHFHIARDSKWRGRREELRWTGEQEPR